MAKIAFTGLTANSFATLKHQWTGAGDEFIEVAEDRARQELTGLARAADVYLIGEEVGNPIKLAQTAHAMDSYLSVLILNDSKSFAKIRQALLFTPFIGNTVKSLSNEIASGLATATQDAILRTRQRRNYIKLTTAPTFSQPGTHLYEDVKSEYLDKFLEEAPIGAVLMTEKGLILAVNRHATEILGSTEKQLIGAPFHMLFTGNNREYTEQLFNSDQHSSTTFTIERNVFQRQILEIRLAQITIKDRVPYRLGLISDLTDKVVAQQKVEQQVEELKRINEQLTSAVSDLDAFVYTASHDLKAPIANIEGLLALIRRKTTASSDPQLDKLFGMVDVSIGRFLDTIKDLSKVALIHQKETDDVEALDPVQMIEEVQALIYETIISTEARISIDTALGFKIRFSKSKFRSIILNLLSNALKYRSTERSPHIQISIKPVPGYCLLSIQDNGLGIPLSKQDKIFSMFKRLHSHVEGRGIGLFIVKRIIETTGSKIEIESTEGAGSTFHLYLKEQRA